MLKYADCPSDFQVIPVKSNLKKQNCLVIAIYAPASQCANYFITALTKILDKYWGSYENTVILMDFNMQPTNQIFEAFLEDNSFDNLIKSNICFKSKPGSCIDLLLPKKQKKFQKHRSDGDRHKKSSCPYLLIFKNYFTKMPPNKLQYRNYKQLKYIHFYKRLNN